MTLTRREIPTHLGVEDKVFYGLSVNQFLYLIIGLAGSYALWNQWAGLPVPLRGALAGAWLLVGTALAVIRPGGRGLEEWAFVALRYAALPKRTTWRAGDPTHESEPAADQEWGELTPRLAWEAPSGASGTRPVGRGRAR